VIAFDQRAGSYRQTSTPVPVVLAEMRVPRGSRKRATNSAFAILIGTQMTNRNGWRLAAANLQNRALDVSASERLRAYHSFAVCCNAPLRA